MEAVVLLSASWSLTADAQLPPLRKLSGQLNLRGPFVSQKPSCQRWKLLPPFAPENLFSQDRFGYSVPRQPAYSRNQAESSIWCLLTGFLPAFRDGFLIHVQPSSYKFRVYQVTKLRTDGVHHRESAGEESVDLNVVRVTCALPFLKPILDTNRIVRIAMEYKAPGSFACRRM